MSINYKDVEKDYKKVINYFLPKVNCDEVELTKLFNNMHNLIEKNFYNKFLDIMYETFKDSNHLGHEELYWVIQKPIIAKILNQYLSSKSNWGSNKRFEELFSSLYSNYPNDFIEEFNNIFEDNTSYMEICREHYFEYSLMYNALNYKSVVRYGSFYHLPTCRYFKKVEQEYGSCELAEKYHLKPCQFCNPKEYYGVPEKVELQKKTGLIIGNTSNNSYHLSSCTYAPKNPSKKIEFDSIDEAISKGYKPCLTCNPK